MTDNNDNNENIQATGTVYVLTNPAMPDLVKIGKTDQDDVHVRVKQLYTTGVPVPFKCEYACRVNDMAKCEKALHEAFSPYRLHAKREFFTIQPKQAVAILRLLGDDVTNVVNNAARDAVRREDDIIGAEAQKKFSTLRKKRSLTFAQMGISSGDKLQLKADNSIEVEVIDDEQKDVLLYGERMHFSHATKKALGFEADKAVRPNDHWEYEGRLLTEIFNDFYDSSDSDEDESDETE